MEWTALRVPDNSGRYLSYCMNTYLCVKSEEPLPDISGLKPFKAVFVIETRVSTSWRTLASQWLVRSGCLYAMAWGNECESWDDAINRANLELYDYSDIPEDSFVMTTWHVDGPLTDVFRFCRHAAYHPSVNLQRTLILHISNRSREVDLLREFDAIGECSNAVDLA